MIKKIQTHNAVMAEENKHLPYNQEQKHVLVSQAI